MPPYQPVYTNTPTNNISRMKILILAVGFVVLVLVACVFYFLPSSNTNLERYDGKFYSILYPKGLSPEARATTTSFTNDDGDQILSVGIYMRNNPSVTIDSIEKLATGNGVTRESNGLEVSRQKINGMNALNIKESGEQSYLISSSGYIWIIIFDKSVTAETSYAVINSFKPIQGEY